MKTYLKALTISLGILALSTIHGFAASWTASTTKGLAIYEIGKASIGQLKFVCDPNNGWADEASPNSTQFFLIATINGHELLDGDVSFKTDHGYSGKITFEAGSALAISNSPTWNKLIKALSEPGRVTVKAGKRQFTLDITDKTALRCAIHG